MTSLDLVGKLLGTRINRKGLVNYGMLVFKGFFAKMRFVFFDDALDSKESGHVLFFESSFCGFNINVG